MRVIATAGHVDHGKSALVRALTGTNPDRWEEERRRGLTIDLGFAWLTLPTGQQLAFVDVPGHERFVPNMLAGVGPVPAVLFVVAADEGWMPQSAEHLAAIDALGIRHGVLAVTRADLADPGPALAAAKARLARSSLGSVPAVAVSAVTGAGLPALLAALTELAGRISDPDPAAPVRLWADRAFSITGSGTVVTGTLPAGRIDRGDELLVTPSMRRVKVRGLQSAGRDTETVTGVARVALNLRGVSREQLARGMALVQPGRWTMTGVIDVRITSQSQAVGQDSSHQDRGSQDRDAQDRDVLDHDDLDRAGQAGAASGLDLARLPPAVTLHIGSARTIARVRPLGGCLVRLALRDSLPLHPGDRVLLRDPGAARPAGGSDRAGVGGGSGDRDGRGSADRDRAGRGSADRALAGRDWAAGGDLAPLPAVLGGVVLDVVPPRLARRGAAAAAARELLTWPDRPTAADLLRRHGLMRESTLGAMGIIEHPPPVADGWLADPGYLAGLTARLGEAVAAHADRNPLARGLPVDAARAVLGLPDRRLVNAVVRPPLQVSDGMVLVSRPAGEPATPALPEAVDTAVRLLRADLADHPFLAPDSDRLAGLGLNRRALAAAARAGLLLRISEQIVLAPGADADATRILAGLPQPFTAAQARQALGTTRRIAIPLLEYLDRAGVTERLPDDRRQLRPR